MVNNIDDEKKPIQETDKPKEVSPEALAAQNNQTQKERTAAATLMEAEIAEVAPDKPLDVGAEEKLSEELILREMYEIARRTHEQYREFPEVSNSSEEEIVLHSVMNNFYVKIPTPDSLAKLSQESENVDKTDKRWKMQVMPNETELQGELRMGWCKTAEDWKKKNKDRSEKSMNTTPLQFKLDIVEAVKEAGLTLEETQKAIEESRMWSEVLRGKMGEKREEWGKKVLEIDDDGKEVTYKMGSDRQNDLMRQFVLPVFIKMRLKGYSIYDLSG